VGWSGGGRGTEASDDLREITLKTNQPILSSMTFPLLTTIGIGLRDILRNTCALIFIQNQGFIECRVRELQKSLAILHLKMSKMF